MPKRRDFLLGSAATATAVSMFPHVNAQTVNPPSKRPEINALRQGYIGQYQGGVYLLPANSETVQWGWFNNAESPRARIKFGLNQAIR